jgi:hypothetical protein
MTEAQAHEIVELAKTVGADATATKYVDPDNWGHLAILTSNPSAVFWAAGHLGIRFDKLPRNRAPLSGDWPNNWTRRDASFYLY